MNTKSKLVYVILIVLIATFSFGCDLTDVEQSPSDNATDNTTSQAISLDPEQETTRAAAQDPNDITDGEVTVHVMDVGEGLSVLIDNKDQEFLIDGGYAKYGKSISEYIGDYVDGPIEYVVATHSHADHVGGLAQIYKDYDALHTIYGDRGTSNQFKAYENGAKNEPDASYEEDENETLALGEGVNVKIIDTVDGDKNTNNNSVVMLFDILGEKVLVTGDAEDKVEKLFADKIGEVDIYVVAHHGSETSSSQILLDKIKPTYGLISSAGPDYSYHNPDPAVIKRLDNMDTIMYATYISGTIVVTIKGKNLDFSPPDSEILTAN